MAKKFETLDIFLRRTFDITTSGLLLLVFSPLMLIIALVIKLDSPGPILYKQRRLKLDGNQVNIWKFRIKAEDFKPSKYSSFVKRLPKAVDIYLKNEELQAILIDYRKYWYGSKPPNLFKHIKVWLKTWKFILVEIIIKQSIAKIRNHFQPLHKPRLPRK